MATLVDIGLTLVGGNKKKNALIEAANAQRAANEYNYTLLGQKKESLKQASKLMRKFSARKDFSDLAKAEVAAFNATGQQSLQAQVENSFVVTNSALQKYRNDVTKDIDLQNAMYLTKLEGDARVEGLLNQADAAMFDAYREAAFQLGSMATSMFGGGGGQPTTSSEAPQVAMNTRPTFNTMGSGWGTGEMYA